MRPLHRALLAGVCLGLSLPAVAQDRRAQYRVLQLADGRELTVEVLATEATGLRLRTPQGEMLLSFELLKDMSPADADAFKLQEAWYVYIAAPEAQRERLVDAYRWVPNTRVQIAGDVVPGLGAPAAAAANRCKGDFPCLLKETAEAPWMWVVAIDVEKDGAVRANSGLNSGPTRTRVEKPGTSEQALWELVHETLQLEVPSDGPPEGGLAGSAGGTTGPTGPETGPTGPSGGNDNLVALSFAPVPGLVAAKQKNGAGVATAVAISTLGTAAFVGAVGHSAQSAPELAGISVVGFYATTVFANQITRKK